MENNSTEPLPTSPAHYLYIVTACTEYSVALPVNLCALALIVSSKRPVIETEILTLNLLLAELMFSAFFFLWLVQFATNGFFFAFLTNFYHASMSVARALFQWHLCVDRYLAVVHPIVFIRYRQIKYRGACLVPLWIIAIACGLSNVFFPLKPVLVSVCGLSLLVPIVSTEILCSLLIVQILRKSGPGERARREKSKRKGNAPKRRAVRIITFLALMAVVNNLTIILFPVFDPSAYSHVFPVALALSTFGSSTQGFLYLNRAKKLQCK